MAVGGDGGDGRGWGGEKVTVRAMLGGDRGGVAHGDSGGGDEGMVLMMMGWKKKVEEEQAGK